MSMSPITKTHSPTHRKHNPSFLVPKQEPPDLTHVKPTPSASPLSKLSNNRVSFPSSHEPLILLRAMSKASDPS